MAVLTEGISVVVPIKTIEAKYEGGLSAYSSNCPNNTFCADDHLVRVGFMTPDDTRNFVQALEKRGFVPHNGQSFVDMAVIDQREGPTGNCSWLSWGRNSKGVTAAWLIDEPSGHLAVSQGWTYENSLSHQSGFVPNEAIPNRLQFLRREGDVEVYLDADTNKEVFVGRVSQPNP